MNESDNIDAVTRFRSPAGILGRLDAQAAASVIAAAADVALIIDRDGIVRDFAFGSPELSTAGYEQWIGQPWIDTVSLESRPKVEALLREAGQDGSGRRRQVNHPSASGDVPVMYSTIRIASTDQVIALGRDLREVSALQQRLVRAQQSLDVDYGRLRQAELRFRLLFQLAIEPVMIVDAGTLDVVECNPAVAQILEAGAGDLNGQPLATVLPAASVASLGNLIAKLGTTESPEDARIRLNEGGPFYRVTAALLRQDKAMHALLRLQPETGREPVPTTGRPVGHSRMVEVIGSLPDGFLVTDLQGNVLAANPAFTEMVHLATEEQVRGHPLQRWLGRGAVDLKVLLSNLREHGSIRLYATSLRDNHGGTLDVEISAVSVPEGDVPCLGFAIRHIGRRMATAIGGEGMVPQSVQQLTELVGRVPMKDLVREATDLIERMCIEAALYLTGDNRASAAEILGLSRQSLYVKLRRHGIGGRGQAAEQPDE